MSRFLLSCGICFLVSPLYNPHVLIAASQVPEALPGLTESEARKILVDSPWAKRVKVRSNVKQPTYVAPIEGPGTQSGGFGPGGPGHGVVPPSADQILSQASGTQYVPCLGWGAGSMSVPSPTSAECKAAWQSVSEVRSAGLPEGSVVVLWESAEPVRTARVRLAISESRAKAPDAIVISVIGHPVLRQINPAGSMKPMIRESAVLIRNGKERIQATDVALIETNDSLVRFYFPRQTAIQPSDKEILFRLEIQDTVVEAKFNVKDMMLRGKVAL